MFLSLLRAGTRMATLWFFIWGVVVLMVRISGAQHTEWLALGLLGFVPLAIVAGARERSRQPAFVNVRACYDRLKACGGILMSEEVSDMAACATAGGRRAEAALAQRTGDGVAGHLGPVRRTGPAVA